MILAIAKKLLVSGAMIGSVVSLSSIAHAKTPAPGASAPICFVDVRSWDDVKAKLPGFMQNNELYAVVQTQQMIGAMKIVQAGRTILMEAHGKHWLIGHVDTVDTITKVCVSGSKINVDLAHGKSNQLEIVPGGLKTQGITFTLTSSVGYNQYLALVPPK
jgi:hypothetical protein